MKEGRGTVYIQNKDESSDIMVSNALVADQEGPIPVELVNFSKEDVYLQGGNKEGRWHARVQCLEEVECRGKVADIRDKMAVGDLSTDEDNIVIELITDFSDVFSQSEHDVGYCEKVPHQIKLIEDRSLRRPYRKIPVNQ